MQNKYPLVYVTVSQQAHQWLIVIVVLVGCGSIIDLKPVCFFFSD